MDTSHLVYERLTRRESDILLLLAQNLSDHEIAERLVLSLNTVKWYTRQIYDKLEVDNRREAVARAQAMGWFRSEAPEKQPSHNLPRHISSFIGREREIDDVVRLVWDHSLVTLTGSGGCGKTRLAQAAAADLLDDFSDGIWYVELAALVDPLLVPVMIANLLGIRAGPNEQQLEPLIHYFDHRQALLVLDNCEHLVQACAELVYTLLTRLPRLKILVTSREPLGINGEVIYRVPSLSLPPGENSPEIEHYEAVRLFIDRAKEHQADFVVTEGQMPVVARICRRLDGIPLAIELAAARTRILSMEQIASRLEDVFSLLTGGSRVDLPRHKTLRACIDTSYQLLSPVEQVFLARLSVFAGEWSFEAAKQVCADEPESQPHAGESGADVKPPRNPALCPEQILDLLSGLVDKSLVQFQVSAAGEPRYHMLETVRQYGWERLTEWGDTDWLRNRHLAYYIQLTGSCPSKEEVPLRLKWQDHVLSEFDNIRMALGWALSSDCAAGLRLGLNAFHAVHIHNTPELLNWLERLLIGESVEMARKGNPRGSPDQLALRGKALLTIADFGAFWGQREQALKAVIECKAIFETQGEPGKISLAGALTTLGILLMVDEPKQSEMFLETSLGYLKPHEESFELAVCYKVMGNLYGYLGDFEKARRSYHEGLRLSRANSFLGEQAMQLNMLGWIERLSGNPDKALELFIEGQAAYARAGQYDHVAGTIYDRTMVAWSRGEDEHLLRLCDELKEISKKTDSVVVPLSVDDILARRDWAMGAYDQAARRAEAALTAYQPYYFSFASSLAYILGRIAIYQKQFDQAARYFRQYDDSADAPRWQRKAYSLHCFGLLAAAQIEKHPKQAERAAVLFGAQEALFDWLPRLFAPIEQREYEQALAAVREALGEEAFITAWNKGRNMERGQIYRFAREIIEDMTYSSTSP